MLLLLSGWLVPAVAGLGPAHTVVLVHGDDPDAVAVAAAYADARDLPPDHVCTTTAAPVGQDEVDWSTFEAVRGDLEGCIAALPQPDEIDAIVTVRGLPLVVTLPSYVVGFEAALQVGRGIDPGGTELAGQGQPGSPAAAWVPNPTYVGGFCSPSELTVTNPYGSWYTSSCELVAEERLPRSHRASRPHETSGYDLQGELRIVSRLDGFDHDDAMALVTRGVEADGAWPTGTWLCMEGADEARAARDPECEHAARHLSLAGEDGLWLTPHDPALAGEEVVAYLTGAADVRGAIDGQTFAPGALACNLTSFGAVPGNLRCSDDGASCPESESQTSIARFVRAGATAAHGTVAEPLNNSFPDAGALLLYASGYSLGESLLFAQQFLYWQNLVLGDPLATPFATRPEVDVPTTVAEAQPLVVTAAHADGITEIRLYIEGVRVDDAEGDQLSWTHGATEGEVLDVLAVAIADDATWQRPGWPVTEQLARTDTQGWTHLRVTVGPAASTTTPPTTTPGGDDTDAPGTDDGEDASGGGCGCIQTHGAPIHGVWMGALVLLARRRRSVWPASRRPGCGARPSPDRRTSPRCPRSASTT